MYKMTLFLHITLCLFSGFVVPFKAHFNENSPIWLLGRCYHARNHGKLSNGKQIILYTVLCNIIFINKATSPSFP